MIDIADIAGIACVFMRMTGCILFNPIFSRGNFPAIFRVGMTLTLTVLVVTFSEVYVDFGTGTFIETSVILVREFLIGFAMGTIVWLFMYTVLLAGAFLDLQMALSMAQMYDPTSNAQMTISSSFFNLMFIFTFFGMNAHNNMIHMFLSSAAIAPFGILTLNTDLPIHIVNVFIQASILGLRMAMPITGMLFVVQIGIGILMKAVPQINAFVVMLQVKILGGLLMFLAVFSPLSEFIENLMLLLKDALLAVLLIV